MRSLVALAGAGLLLAGLGLTSPAPSSAAPHTPVAPKASVVSLGQATAPDFTCPGAGFTLIQTAAVAPISYVTPFAGVVTSYSYVANSVPGSIRLVFLKPGAVAGHYDVLGYHQSQPVAVSTPNTFPARIKLGAGVMLGLYTSSAGMGCFASGFTASDSMTGAPFDPTASTDFAPGAALPNIRLDLAATFEPDADNDGYGDVTQDACPTSDLTFLTCDRVTVPDTTFTKKPAKRSTKRKVKAAFVSTVATATFECSIDQRPFKPCLTPYRNLLPYGKHVLKVQAVGPTGLVDPTPAQVKFTIRRPH